MTQTGTPRFLAGNSKTTILFAAMMLDVGKHEK